MGRREPLSLERLVSGLARHGRRRAVGVAGDLGVRWWSYRRLADEAGSAAALLARQGIGAGDRVLIWAVNSPEWAAAFLAILSRGAVAVLVDVQEPAAFVGQVVAQERPALCLHDLPDRRSELAAAAGAGGGRWQPLSARWRNGADAEALAAEPLAVEPTATERSPAEPRPVAAAASAAAPGGRSAAPLPDRLAGGELPRPAPAAFADPAAVGPDAPAATVYSSGATGAPKGIVLSRANLEAQLAPFARRRWLGALPFRFLVLPPLSHVLGLVVGLLVPLSLGHAALYTAGNHPARWLRLIHDYRIAVLVAVPRTLELLAAALLRTRGRGGTTLAADLAAAGTGAGRWLLFWRRGSILGRVPFRLILVGGARLPVAVETFWRRAGILVMPGYGLTETASFVTIGSPFAPAGRIGRPLGGQQLRLAPDGEILVRGPSLGHVEDGGALELTADGFLRTGDLGRLDAAGRLVFAGRKKEIIVTGEGHNVDPHAVEAALEQSAGVREAAAVARQGAAGEEVHAVLVLDPDATPSAAVAEANRRLPPPQRIAGWTVWPHPALPRTTLGKLRRAAMARAVAGLPAGAAPGSMAPAGGLCPEPAGPGGGEIAADREGSSGASHRDVPLKLDDLLHEGERRLRLRHLARYLLQERADAAEPPDLTLAGGLGLGSLDVVELAGLIEDATAVPPPPIAAGTTLVELRQALRHAAAAARLERQAVAAALQTPRWLAPQAGSGPHREGFLSRPGLLSPPEASPAGASAPGPVAEPRWAAWRAAVPWRAAVRWTATRLWAAAGYRVSARWDCDPVGLPRPLLLAAAPHRHWQDALAVYLALPPALRRHAAVVTNRDFARLPAPGAPTGRRLALAAAYHLGLPSLFRFTVLAPFGRTREGLQRTAVLLDRGLVAITFPLGMCYWGRPDPGRHDAGIALLAIETGTPLLPVALPAAGPLGWHLGRPRRRIEVRFGEPIWPAPASRPEDLVAGVESALAALAAAGG